MEQFAKVYKEGGKKREKGIKAFNLGEKKKSGLFCKVSMLW